MTRTSLVTGANSGIGLATALELARRGQRTIGTVRSPAKAKVLRAAAAEAGVEVETAILDVTDADRCAAVIERFEPDILINNAGYAQTAPVESVDDAAAEHLLGTMLVAPIRLARLALPHMRANGWGRIVNVSSILGRVTMPLTGWYQASKHGLEAVTDALRIECAADGVSVVLVEPGFFRTAIFEDLEADAEQYGDGRYAVVYERLRTMLQSWEPLMGNPDSVASTIATAVEASRPRARYLVGPDAQLLDATRSLTPTVLRDRATRLLSGL
jgi:NAD(P)-dependent dehydrogenase (short-subunit alcohol dehydrogenase family)